MADNEITIYEPVDKEKVKTQILEIRGYRVMIDKDIAEYILKNMSPVECRIVQDNNFLTPVTPTLVSFIGILGASS